MFGRRSDDECSAIEHAIEFLSDQARLLGTLDEN